jgi:hypothetical protein
MISVRATDTEIRMPDDKRERWDNPELQAHLQQFLSARPRIPPAFDDLLDRPVPQALIDTVMGAPRTAPRKWWRFGW